MYNYYFNNKNLDFMAGVGLKPPPVESGSKLIFCNPNIVKSNRPIDVLFTRSLNSVSVKLFKKMGLEPGRYFHMEDKKIARSTCVPQVSRKAFGTDDYSNNLVLNALYFISLHKFRHMRVYNWKIDPKHYGYAIKIIKRLGNRVEYHGGSVEFIKKIQNNMELGEDNLLKLAFGDTGVIRGFDENLLFQKFDFDKQEIKEIIKYIPKTETEVKFINHDSNLGIQNYGQDLNQLLNDIREQNQFNMKYLQINNISKKNLILVKENFDELEEYMEKNHKNSDFLMISDKPEFGKIFFETDSEEEVGISRDMQNEYFLLGFANYLQKHKKYDRVAWLDSSGKTKKVTLENYEENILNIINNKKYTFTKRNGGIYPTTRVLVELDDILKIKELDKKKEMLDKIFNFYKEGIYICILSSQYTESEILNLFENKKFFQVCIDKNATIEDFKEADNYDLYL